MAKEFFEDRRMTGRIQVSCKYDDGTTRVWAADKAKIVQHIVDIVEEFAEDGYVLTLRQLHYQLVSRNWIINHDSAYKKLGKILDDCRYSGIIDWKAIEDRGRVPYIPYSVEDVEDALEDTINQYRLDRQRGQSSIVELWTEKDALSGILRRTTVKYHIRLVVNKGYTSSSAMYRAYERITTNLYKPGSLGLHKTVILYFGDHDPSGLDMIRDIRDRLTFMLMNGECKFSEYQIDDVFEIIPIGLTQEQIQEYNLPPNPTKVTDSRSKNYVEEFGRTCWEVDALRPDVLTSIVEDNIQEHIDMEQYEAILEQEQKEIKELKSLIKK